MMLSMHPLSVSELELRAICQGFCLVSPRSSLVSQRCPRWVTRVISTVSRQLPIYPHDQRFSASVGMSQRCHDRKISYAKTSA
jgi:hypothetical protein